MMFCIFYLFIYYDLIISCSSYYVHSFFALFMNKPFDQSIARPNIEPYIPLSLHHHSRSSHNVCRIFFNSSVLLALLISFHVYTSDYFFLFMTHHRITHCISFSSLSYQNRNLANSLL
jgi:hypothetical protein